MKLLFVTDLDGTFVKNSVTVSDKDLEAYKKIQTLGDFSVATGRSKKEIEYIRDNYNLNVKHYIGLNGATISTDEQIIKSTYISNGELTKVLSYLEKNSLIFDALNGKERIGNFEHEKKDRVWNMPIICVDNPYKLIKDRTIYKINVRPKKDEAEFYLQDLIVNFPSLAIYQTGATRIEITAPGISKASAINEVKSDYDKVLVFGDSGNDVDMFKVADISYCMSSAPEEVKQYATYVVEDFAEAIEHFLKNF